MITDSEMNPHAFQATGYDFPSQDHKNAITSFVLTLPQNVHYSAYRFGLCLPVFEQLLVIIDHKQEKCETLSPLINIMKTLKKQR